MKLREYQENIRFMKEKLFKMIAKVVRNFTMLEVFMWTSLCCLFALLQPYYERLYYFKGIYITKNILLSYILVFIVLVEYTLVTVNISSKNRKSVMNILSNLLFIAKYSITLLLWNFCFTVMKLITQVPNSERNSARIMYFMFVCLNNFVFLASTLCIKLNSNFKEEG